jgi:hypothetical protein
MAEARSRAGVLRAQQRSRWNVLGVEKELASTPAHAEAEAEAIEH